MQFSGKAVRRSVAPTSGCSRCARRTSRQSAGCCSLHGRSGSRCCRCGAARQRARGPWRDTQAGRSYRPCPAAPAVHITPRRSGPALWPEPPSTRGRPPSCGCRPSSCGRLLRAFVASARAASSGLGSGRGCALTGGVQGSAEHAPRREGFDIDIGVSRNIDIKSTSRSSAFQAMCFTRSLHIGCLQLFPTLVMAFHNAVQIQRLQNVEAHQVSLANFTEHLAQK